MLPTPDLQQVDVTSKTGVPRSALAYLIKLPMELGKNSRPTTIKANVVPVLAEDQ
jgi:hypothetical protein